MTRQVKLITRACGHETKYNDCLREKDTAEKVVRLRESVCGKCRQVEVSRESTDRWDRQKAAEAALREWAKAKGYTGPEYYCDIATDGAPDPFPSMRVYKQVADKRHKGGYRLDLVDGKRTGRGSVGADVMLSEAGL